GRSHTVLSATQYHCTELSFPRRRSSDLGRRIVTGIDMLAPFNLGIGAMFALAEKDGAVPDRNNLPRGIVRLYHASEAEMAEVARSEEHTSELQSRENLVCRLLLEKKK